MAKDADDSSGSEEIVEENVGILKRQEKNKQTGKEQTDRKRTNKRQIVLKLIGNG
jgi:hypothetical protein